MMSDLRDGLPTVFVAKCDEEPVAICTKHGSSRQSKLAEHGQDLGRG